MPYLFDDPLPILIAPHVGHLYALGEVSLLLHAVRAGGGGGGGGDSFLNKLSGNYLCCKRYSGINAM